jgi:hypothetical protein
MANLTITSRKTGEVFHFWMNGDRGYIYREFPERRTPSGNKMVGTNGSQICHGGHSMGSTLYATSEESFKAQCRSWYRAYMRTESQEY